MDLNTALMEITSMSECYVAANMRTSFTDLPESGSLSSNLSTGGLSSTAQSNLSSSSDFHPHQQQQQHLKQEQLQQQQQFTSSTSSSSSSSQIQNSNHRPLSASEAATAHHDLIHSPHHGLNRTIEDHHLGGASGSINNINQHQQLQSVHSQTNHFGARNSHNHNHSYSIPNSIPHHRLSQPTRTQIPIHCYIEQLDACADLPGYNPTITDNELFSTSNKSLPNQQNHSNPYQQSHLHQSKLALESVTNQCNGILGNSSTRNETSSANIDLANDSDNNNEDIDNCSNNNSAINTNSSSLFHDSEVDNNPGGNDIDVNLDHLTSDSPNSTHNQLHSHQDSNNISASFNHIAPSSPAYDGHHFQACRETYAIVTSNVLYIDLLRTVLLQLGYSAMDLINAKATIQIKNWKPLALDQITDDKEATVGEVLGYISNFVTLRIRLYRIPYRGHISVDRLERSVCGVVGACLIGARRRVRALCGLFATHQCLQAGLP